MQCLILAGGLGTRMQAVAGDVPKTLIPVAGRPFADHQLNWLKAHGVERVVYAIGHRGDAIRDFAGSGAAWDLRIDYSDDGDEPLGTGGAVRLAVERGLMDPGFLVLYGDSYLELDIGALWRASDGGAKPTMCVLGNDGQWGASNAHYENGRVTRYEKGIADPAAAGMRHIDYGLSVLPAGVVAERIPADTPFDLARFYGRLAAGSALSGYEVTRRFYEIGSPEGLKELEAYLAGGD